MFRNPKRVLAATLLAVGTAAVVAVTPAASGHGIAKGKPVIGKPVTSLPRPLAGKPFAVSFKVSRSDTHKPLLTGKMVCDPSVEGTVIRHAESFRAGIARLSFVVPKDAGGKQLKVRVTIKANGLSATKVSVFTVVESPVKVSISDASITEGNTGTTQVAVPVALDTASSRAVTVDYQTNDGTATAGSDYTATGGKLTFQPGETAKSIPVSVIGDTAIEADEQFTVTLSNPSGATITNNTATVTITNDDTASPITAGMWQGATQEGNYVFFTVTPSRTITQFRTNSLTENCSSGGSLRGSVNWGSQAFPIGSDGTFAAQANWSGSETSGDIEFTAETWKIAGSFTSATAMNGTVSMADEFNYEGNHYSCSGSVTFSATLH